jgi:hypothetical protein
LRTQAVAVAERGGTGVFAHDPEARAGHSLMRCGRTS